jgi:peptidyl-prolyl cis-trans isomerase C
MFRMIRAGALCLAVMGLAKVGDAQEPATAKGTSPVGAVAGVAPVIPGATDVVATVTSRNQTDKITKGDVLRLLSQYPLPPADEREMVYDRALEILINNRLLNHYLVSQRVQVPESTIEQQIEGTKQRFKQEGQDLLALLQQSGKSLDEFRKEIVERLRFPEYTKTQATDARLKEYMREHRDLFAGTQVRASHIMLKLESNASKEQKEKVKQRLGSIRKEIVGGQIAFAAAANKYSEDPANAGGAGGDLDYFTLKSGFVEEFAEAAFKLKKGEVSEPVETPFGLHLIQVTDRKEGKLPDFEQIKPYIVQDYMTDLQKKIVGDERQTAKIEQKPMPKDFFPSPPAEAAGAVAPAAAPAGGTTPAPKP